MLRGDYATGHPLGCSGAKIFLVSLGGRGGRPGIVVGSVALGDMIGSTCGGGPGQASGPVRAAAEVKTSSGEAEPPGTMGIKEIANAVA